MLHEITNHIRLFFQQLTVHFTWVCIKLGTLAFCITLYTPFTLIKKPSKYESRGLANSMCGIYELSQYCRCWQEFFSAILGGNPTHGVGCRAERPSHSGKINRLVFNWPLNSQSRKCQTLGAPARDGGIPILIIFGLKQRKFTDKKRISRYIYRDDKIISRCYRQPVIVIAILL